MYELEVKQEYNLTRDFEKIPETFTRIKTEDIEYCEKEALRVMGKSAQYPIKKS